MSEYHQQVNRRAWELRTRLSQPKRQAKKPSHEKLAADYERFLADGGEPTILPTYTPGPLKPRASFNRGNGAGPQ
jgi:hypothetical protein